MVGGCLHSASLIRPEVNRPLIRSAKCTPLFLTTSAFYKLVFKISQQKALKSSVLGIFLKPAMSQPKLAVLVPLYVYPWPGAWDPLHTAYFPTNLILTPIGINPNFP